MKFNAIAFTNDPKVMDLVHQTDADGALSPSSPNPSTPPLKHPPLNLASPTGPASPSYSHRLPAVRRSAEQLPLPNPSGGRKPLHRSVEDLRSSHMARPSPSTTATTSTTSADTRRTARTASPERIPNAAVMFAQLQQLKASCGRLELENQDLRRRVQALEEARR